MSQRLKMLLGQTLWLALGRKNFARLGRFLWLYSRLDVTNDMSSNGELILQRAVARELARAPSVCILDVGANVGDWTSHMIGNLEEVRLSADAWVMHLFEPAPAAQQALERRLSRHGERVVIVPKAVGVEEGQVRFSVFDPISGINTLQPISSDDPPEQEITVECTTLERYCAQAGIDHIDLLKIDTEGNDFNVLRGAVELLKAGRISYIQFEYNHRWVAFRHFLKDVFDLLSPLGYSLGKLTPRGVEHYRRWHPELETYREGNYLLWRDRLPPSLPRVKWWLD